MAESARGSTTVRASAAGIMDVIADFAGYPEWAQVTSTKVVDEGTGGRAKRVAFVIDVPVLGEARYTLEYEWDGDDGVSWTTAETDGKLQNIEGSYTLEELDEDETKVTYEVSADISLSVPSFLKKQGQRQVVKSGLDGLKKRVESRR